MSLSPYIPTKLTILFYKWSWAVGRFSSMSDSTAVVLKPTLDPRSDSTQICCPGLCVLGFAFTRPACRHLHHISAWSFFPLSLRRRQMGEEKWVLLGLKLFHVWASNAVDPFSFTSCGSIHVRALAGPSASSLGASAPAFRNWHSFVVSFSIHSKRSSGWWLRGESWSWTWRRMSKWTSPLSKMRQPTCVSAPDAGATGLEGSS